MKEKNILLTGYPGQLANKIVSSGFFSHLLHPTIDEMDIRKSEQVAKFFSAHNFDAIIHCAALARMSVCQKTPVDAIETNIIGTSYLIIETLKKQKDLGKIIRFLHISTDGVYQSSKGGYVETSSTIPYNHYGWSKLGAEAAVNLLENHCIVRTRFFDPDRIPFETSATDIYTSKIPIMELVEALVSLMGSDFVGTINIGGCRQSEFDVNKRYKPQLKPTSYQEISKEANFPIGKDASMNVEKWQALKSQKTRGV